MSVERLAVFTIEEMENVLKPVVVANINVPKNDRKNSVDISLNGYKIHALSDRYKLFFTKGYSCCSCGVKGSFFALERNVVSKKNNKNKENNPERPHLNLYAINEFGEEILMTKDHILPKSKGGKNCLENYQTMCTVCNCKKGNEI